MSPLYDYRCTHCGEVKELLRRAEQRDEPTVCSCGYTMERCPSLVHRQPDGIYSYAPNIGDANAFERRTAEARERGR